MKSFHPLVKGIPIRVGRKEITCLRDLEKVLLWLAPVSEIFTSMGKGVWHLILGFFVSVSRRLAHLSSNSGKRQSSVSTLLSHTSANQTFDVLPTARILTVTFSI